MKTYTNLTCSSPEIADEIQQIGKKSLEKGDHELVTPLEVACDSELPQDSEPRALSEIFAAEEELSDQVWFNRHMNLRFEIRQGDVKVVTHEEWVKAGCNNQTHIIDSVLQSAIRAAADVYQRLGRAKCGPHDDFEWGMINGKLSAIRWVLGDEWDMLDT